MRRLYPAARALLLLASGWAACWLYTAQADDSPPPPPGADRIWEARWGERCLSLRSQPAADRCPPPGSRRGEACPCEEGDDTGSPARIEPETKRGEL